MGPKIRMSVLSLITAIVFGIEIKFMFFQNEGRYAPHSNAAPFVEWSHSSKASTFLHFHAFLLLLWIFIVFYQCVSAGKGWHKIVGWFGSLFAGGGVWQAIIMVPTTIPALHSICFIRCFDLMLIVGGGALVIELISGIQKIRSKCPTKDHVTHMEMAVVHLFSPALYRIFVSLFWILLGNFHQTCDQKLGKNCFLSWVHELSILLTSVIVILYQNILFPKARTISPGNWLLPLFFVWIWDLLYIAFVSSWEQGCNFYLEKLDNTFFTNIMFNLHSLRIVF